MGEYDCLKLDNQLCFPLYAVSREIIKRYKPFLSKIDLTYTQYIVMMVLWEKESINVKHLGERLYLDSGTLTPLLKVMENKELITRNRSVYDERNLIVTITDKGIKLKDRAKSIPKMVGSCVKLEEKEISELYRILYKILGSIDKEDINV